MLCFLSTWQNWTLITAYPLFVVGVIDINFVKEFRELIAVIMGFEPSLVVIPYPGGTESHKGRPFTHEALTLVSSYKCKIYMNDLFIIDGKPTTVKIFIGHDSPAAISNSLELAKLADKKDGSVQVCFIQASKVVFAGYLNGSINTMDVNHWTEQYNCLPCLHNIDIEVKMLNIEDPTGEPQKWNSRNQVFVAHILCSEKNEDKVNAQFGNMYCKERKASRAAGEIQKGRTMKYVPYESTGVITQSPKRFAKLQKNRLCTNGIKQRHHPIKFWGFHNIYKVLTAPKGAGFTIY